ncbi:MAG: type III-A CRISPR-associated RAMP protein Csm4 [Parasporobacterium sp.]|nr:type III-A CRISPR-associated RAMP protein Csm4 [Parasporobacterium sp.]
MKYQLFRLSFTTGVHFGTTSLEESGFLFAADTLFSALCIEALKQGDRYFELFYSSVKEGKLLFSDGLPYINDSFYIPRPHLYIERQASGDSGQKKAVRKLTHLPVDSLKDYLAGNMDFEKEGNIFRNIGKYSSRTSAAVRGREDSLPYRIGIFNFMENAGIYILVVAADDKLLKETEELLIALSFTGIGGRRSQGLGKYDLFLEKKLPESLHAGLEAGCRHYMTLSISMPQKEELENVIPEAGYKLVKRSGFVFSDSYAESFQRKKDFYLFSSGSCFTTRFNGDVYDVSGFGSHPVYRYAKPIFIGVDQ